MQNPSSFHRLAAPVLLFVLGLPALHSTETGVLARIGDTEVKAEDIRASLESLDPREQAALSRDPAFLNQAVRALLARRIVLNEALAKKWEQQPSVVQSLERARENTLVETYLQAVSQPPADYPSEAELKTLFAANQSVLLAPRQYRLAQIFIASPKGADEARAAQARQKTDAIQKSLGQPGVDFTILAKTQSEGSEAAERGGETGWLAETQIRPEIRSVATRLSPGETSEPIQLEDGWHIVKLLEIKEPSPLPFVDVRDVLKEKIRAERIQANRKAYLARLLEQNPVSVNEIALSGALSAPLDK